MANKNIKSLREIVKIKGGKRLPKGEVLQKDPNLHPYIKVKDMESKYVDKAFLEYVPDDVFIHIKNYIVNQNDVIISIVGTIGRVCIVDKDLDNASLSENCVKLSGLDYIDANYLYYFLISSLGKEKINKGTVGAVQQKLPLYSIEAISLDWKTRQVREKIVNILKSLDDKIQLNTDTNRTLEQIAQAVFQHWFIDFAPVRAKAQARAQGKSAVDIERAAMMSLSGKTADELTALATRNPTAYTDLQTLAAAFPDELTTTEQGEVPKGWEVKQVGDIVERLKTKKKLTKKDIKSDGKTLVLEQGSNIFMGYTDDDAEFKANLKEPLFIFGDHTCITHLSTKHFSVYQNVITLKGKNIPTLWVYFAVKDKQKFQEYRRHWMEFIIHDVIVPDNDFLINEFVNKTSILFFYRDCLLEQNKTLTQTRDALLPKLLSGELL